MSSAPGGTPWTVWVVGVLAAVPVVGGLIVAPLIWGGLFDDGDPGLAVLVVLTCAVPLGLVVVMARSERGRRAAWLALLAIGAAGAIAFAVAASPALFVPLIADVLLLTPTTQRYVRRS